MGRQGIQPHDACGRSPATVARRRPHATAAFAAAASLSGSSCPINRCGRTPKSHRLPSGRTDLLFSCHGASWGCEATAGTVGRKPWEIEVVDPLNMSTGEWSLPRCEWHRAHVPGPRAVDDGCQRPVVARHDRPYENVISGQNPPGSWSIE
jgi:hypothetical protein